MNNTSITNSMIEQSAIASAQALFTVQQATAGTIMQGSKYQEQMGKLMMQMAETALSQAVQNLQTLTNEESKEKCASLFGKIFGGILSGLMCIVSVLTAQPELAIVSIAMYALSVSGGMKWAEDKIADVLHTFGVPKSVGRIIGSIVLIVAAVAIGGSGGVRALIGKAACLIKCGVEAGASAAAKVVEQVAEEVTEEVGSTASISVKARLMALLKKIPAPLARAITAGAMATGSVNLAENIGAATHNKKLADALAGVLAILSLVAGVIGGGALATGETNSLVTLGSKGTKTLFYGSSMSAAGQGAANTATGVYSYQQADTALQLGSANAVFELFNGLREMGTEQWGSLIKQMDSLLKTTGHASNQVAEGMSSVNAQVAQLMA